MASLYNALPSVDEASNTPFDRTRIFSELAVLLAAYDYKYGVCLVHAHCKLDDGEVMVATGHTSQPERDVECYPERWLPSGEPFEFTRQPTVAPPPELFEKFRIIVNGLAVLGLYAAATDEELGVWKEWTEGRKNITRLVDTPDPKDIETGWMPGREQPITMNCSRQCIFDARYGSHQKVHVR